MKLVYAMISRHKVTKISFSGGFLRKGNTDCGVSYQREEEVNHIIKNILYVIGFLLAATGIGQIFYLKGMQETNIVLVYIVAVFLTARFADSLIWGILASVLAAFFYNFFFTEPRFTLSVYNPDYFITFICMTATAVFTGLLTMKVKVYAGRAIEREKDIHALYVFTGELSRADTIEKIGNVAQTGIQALLGGEVTFLYGDDAESCVCGERFPVGGEKGAFGFIKINRYEEGEITGEHKTLLHTMLDNIGIAVARVCASEERYRSRELMEQEKYRANLLRGISHDLRTPLMGIMGTSEMIAGMSDDADPRKGMARDIYQDADWLHSLVENILGLTRLSDGGNQLVRPPEPLEEIISSAIKRVEKRAAGYEIEVELPEDYIEVPADARLLEQVFVNLLDNAVKHTPPEKKIKVLVEKPHHTFVKIRVMDRGEGISEKDLSHIFEMFYTSAERAADVKKGIGLGLAICKTVITAHGGDIMAANREGGGASVTITLPLAEKGNSYV